VIKIFLSLKRVCQCFNYPSSHRASCSYFRGKLDW